MRQGTRSLAELGPDQTVRVRRIFFDGPRRQCGALGLHEGDRLSGGRWEGASLLVRTGDGGSVRCPVELARFVEVEGAGS